VDRPVGEKIPFFFIQEKPERDLPYLLCLQRRAPPEPACINTGKTKTLTARGGSGFTY
jgi:hypothetical protein